MRLAKPRGQTLTEVSLLFTAVAMAFFGIQLYFQRNMQAKYQGGVSSSLASINDAAAARNLSKTIHLGEGYEPGYQESYTRDQFNSLSDIRDSSRTVNDFSSRRGWRRVTD